MLIATLPPVYREELLYEMIACPEIGGVRYNTGMVSPYPPEETLRLIKALTDQHQKKFWVDLKGRQLRVIRWAQPDYGNIVVNHDVEIDGDAWVFLRDGERHALKFAHKNVLYLDPPPRHAVGEGQSLNILGENVRIVGYLTESDRSYIKAARELGIEAFMLSFVESQQDIDEVRAEFGQACELVLKIESPAGVTFVSGLVNDPAEPYQLMAARDDLFITIGDNKTVMLSYLREIVRRDPEAIVASRLFSGIERDGNLALSDITDIELMSCLGYKHFMLSDEICHRHFEKTIIAWRSILQQT